MARPRMTDGATERMNLIIPSEEMASIEDWRFRNRVPSKSEAMRRLCQIGIAFERDGEIARKRSERAVKALILTIERMEKDIAKAPKGIRGSLAVALTEQMEALRAITAVFMTSQIMKSDAIAETDALLERVAVHLEFLKDGGRNNEG